MGDFLKFYHSNVDIQLNEETLEMTVTQTVDGEDLAHRLYYNEQVLENDEFIIFPEKDKNGNIILYKMKKENENG